jgi:putative hydrolase of the HAD superfamily
LLIIFDLDDTLIDTSGCITPVKLEDALVRMMGEGLVIPDFQEAIESLKQIDRASESAQSTLSEFLEILDADPRFLDIGVQEIYYHLSPDIPVSVLDGALRMLSDLGQSHQLALVTTGKEAQQYNKMKKAGIDSAIFSKIVVSETGSKKPHYQAIMDELGYEPASVIVCGDRIGRDLVPGRELGCRTVHVQWGRGLGSTGKKGDVDYSISHLGRLKEIIEEYGNK